MSDVDGHEPDLTSAAIVCEHVAKTGAPILLAERAEPQDPADSGWQFLCGVAEENSEMAQVWALGEVLSSEPSLEGRLQSPIGTVLRRSSTLAEWSDEES